MKIRCAFAMDPDSPDEAPTLIAAVDEYTEEIWGCIPDFYKDEMKKQVGMTIRECIIWVPDSPIEKLFEVPEIQGTVKKDG